MASLFTDTFDLCINHVPEDPHIFFTLLASQLLQRLVKALPTSKAITPESASYLKGFVDMMVANHDRVRPVEEPALSHHEEVMRAIKAVMDFSSSSAALTASVDLLKKAEHFAAQAFALLQGRKMLEAAEANSKSKEAVAGVLAVVEAAESELQESGLCLVDSCMVSSLKDCFTAEHGQLVSGHIRNLKQKGMKALKGPDKEKLARVQQLARDAVYAIVIAHVHHDLLPFVETASAAWDAQEVPGDTVLLKDDSCLMNLADGCGHGCEGVIAKIKGFSHFAQTSCEKFQSTDGPIQATGANQMWTDWRAKSSGVVAAFKTMVLESTFKEHEGLNTVIESLEQVMNSCGESLKKKLEQAASGKASELVQAVLDRLVAIVSGEEVNLPDFYAGAEQCQLYANRIARCEPDCPAWR